MFAVKKIKTHSINNSNIIMWESYKILNHAVISL